MNDFAARRRAFMERLGDGVAILPTAPVYIKTADQEHHFRPDSDFFYLTGFGEPEAVAVFVPHHPQHQFILFVRPRDKEMEIWNGRRAGIDGAKTQYGADAAYSYEELDEKLPQYLEGAKQIYYHFSHNDLFNERVINWLHGIRRKARGGVAGPAAIVDPASILHEMRLLKRPDEIENLRRAGDIAANAHKAAMAATAPGQYEYQIQAEIEYVFRQNGTAPSYGSIVGGGANATILHYHENSDRLNDGDLLLIDAGCEYASYASDITRTFPVSGKFSPAQSELYDVVLRAQKAAIAECRPGKRFCDPHQAALRVLTEGLVQLGLLKGDVDTLVAEEAYKPYYMHKTGHWLGMDVHDVGHYKVEGEWRTFEPGMVLTVEPGLYVGPDAAPEADRYRGIGIRIEDDVLITADGHEILTAGVPKEISEIEALMGQDKLATVR